MRRASLLLTSMPGMCVLDAHVQHRCGTRSRRFSACDDLSLQYGLSLVADGNERLT